jgi:hypothetical protein
MTQASHTRPAIASTCSKALRARVRPYRIPTLTTTRPAPRRPYSSPYSRSHSTPTSPAPDSKHGLQANTPLAAACWYLIALCIPVSHVATHRCTPSTRSVYGTTAASLYPIARAVAIQLGPCPAELPASACAASCKIIWFTKIQSVHKRARLNTSSRFA